MTSRDAPHATVGDATEEALVLAMIARVPHAAPPEGPGDDAALVPRGPDRVVTTDALVEGIHFLRAHPPAWLGWKALMVNLTDVAAMGARPEGFLVAAALPAGAPLSWWEALADGMGELARDAGVLLAGGDVVRSPGAAVLTITAWGRLEDTRPLRRSGGRPGDLLMVHGPVGRAGVGLSRWLREAGDTWGAEPPEAADAALAAHLRPSPDLAAGPFAARAGATAGMDTSDGLATDAPRLARASAVGLEIDLDRLPDDPACAGATADERAAGGEDHGQLVLVPPSLEGTFRARGFATIGRAVDGAPEVGWLRAGRPTSLAAKPFAHFR